MNRSKYAHGSYSSYLALYPALKQTSKDKICLSSPNTRQEQIHVRKLLAKRVFHYNDFKVFKTIVLDVRFIKKAWKNLIQSKSFHEVELYICEPIVFDLLAQVFRELSKKTINKLIIHLNIRDTSKNILEIIDLLHILKRPRAISLNFESSQSKDFLYCLPTICATLERLIPVVKSINLTFQGASVFYADTLVSKLRYWKSTVSISVVPSDVQGPIQIGSQNHMLSNIMREPRPARHLRLSFWYLKRFGNDALRELLRKMLIVKGTRSLCFVLNRFELNDEKAELIGEFMREIKDLEQLEFLVYYLKYQKMHYTKVLDAIGAKGQQLKRLLMGYMVIKPDFQETLVRVLSGQQRLEILQVYWDIKEILNVKGFWQFLDKKEQLTHLEMILTCSSSILDENKEDMETSLLENLKELFGYIKVLPGLKSLVLILPEIFVEVGELLNDLVIGNLTIGSIRLDCEKYNFNYLWELREIQKIRPLKIEVNTEQKSQLEELKNDENFRLNMHSYAYDHFAKVHEAFFNKYIPPNK